MAAAIVTLGWAVPAGAATNVYQANSGGYDVSWPNCGATPPSSFSTFAIVGLGDGRPFTTSGCLTAEWTAANTLTGSSPGPALYFNTGYSGAYGRDITASCAALGPTFKKTVPKHDQRAYTKAWQIGCSEAAYAKGVATANHEAPSMWWADIETGNSWAVNQTLNQYTVDGISYEMHTFGGPAGVYSNAGSWDKLVGATFTPTPAFTGDWGGNLSCQASRGFSPASVWVVQGGTVGSVDTDIAC